MGRQKESQISHQLSTRTKVAPFGASVSWVRSMLWAPESARRRRDDLLPEKNAVRACRVASTNEKRAVPDMRSHRCLVLIRWIDSPLMKTGFKSGANDSFSTEARIITDSNRLLLDPPVALPLRSLEKACAGLAIAWTGTAPREPRNEVESGALLER